MSIAEELLKMSPEEVKKENDEYREIKFNPKYQINSFPRPSEVEARKVREQRERKIWYRVLKKLNIK